MTMVSVAEQAAVVRIALSQSLPTFGDAERASMALAALVARCEEAERVGLDYRNEFLKSRELRIARKNAEEWLTEYARLAFEWNAPDDEYTRRCILALAERAITAHDPSRAAETTE